MNLLINYQRKIFIVIQHPTPCPSILEGSILSEMDPALILCKIRSCSNS